MKRLITVSTTLWLIVAFLLGCLTAFGAVFWAGFSPGDGARDVHSVAVVIRWLEGWGILLFAPQLTLAGLGECGILAILQVPVAVFCSVLFWVKCGMQRYLQRLAFALAGYSIAIMFTSL